MAMNFGVYQSKATVLGTVAELALAGGSLKFTHKTLVNPKKLLCVVILRKDGTSDTATCGETVTMAIRRALDKGMSKKQALASLAKLQVLEGNNGGNYISAPVGELGEFYAIEELATEKSIIDWEEAVAV